jgi:hypothetical protein
MIIAIVFLAAWAIFAGWYSNDVIEMMLVVILGWSSVGMVMSW